MNKMFFVMLSLSSTLFSPEHAKTTDEINAVIKVKIK